MFWVGLSAGAAVSGYVFRRPHGGKHSHAIDASEKAKVTVTSKRGISVEDGDRPVASRQPQQQPERGRNFRANAQRDLQIFTPVPTLELNY